MYGETIFIYTYQIIFLNQETLNLFVFLSFRENGQFKNKPLEFVVALYFTFLSWLDNVISDPAKRGLPAEK